MAKAVRGLERWALLCWAGSLAVLSVACGGDVRAPVAAQGAVSAQQSASSDQASWYYHPSRAPSLLARYALDERHALYLGRYGDRWLVNSAERTVQVAADMAPTALVAALQQGNRDWVFVGADGIVYQSSAALGAFQRIRKPPQPMVEVSAHGSTVLGVARGGQLWRSGDLGNSWQRVGTTQRFADVAFGADGTAVAFSVPEQHWSSTDQGQSWSAVGTPFGALLLSSQQSAIEAQAVLGRYRWQRSSSAWDPISAPAEKIELPFSPPRGPSAEAVLTKRAAIIGGDYVELEHALAASSASGSAGREWQLWRGPLRGALRATPLPQLRCDAAKLAGFSNWLWLACAKGEGRREGRDGDVVELWSSADRGGSWSRISQLSHASLKTLVLAVGEGGRLLVSGLCEEAKRGCLPQGIQYLAVSTPLRSSAVPMLLGSAEHVVFAPDGKTAYALGRSTKNDLLGLFVSRDGGVSFTPQSVSGVTVRRDGASLGVSAVSANEDDTITIAFSSLPASTARILWLDAQGRVLALSAPPKDRVTLAVQGSRAVAVDRNGIGVWESRNAGASWVERPPLPGAVCVPSTRNNECPVEVVCAEAGCVFAESLTRLGWDGSTELATELATSTASEAPHSDSEPRQAAMSCRLTDPGWQRLASGASAPTVDQAALGNYSWFIVADDASSTEVTVWRVPREQAATLEKRQLLAPLNDAAGMAYHASLQVEGAAAIRYRVPDRIGGPIGRVEIAWEDLIHETSSHSVLPDAGLYRQDDSTENAAGTERALPALVSITEGGLYLQVHGESSREQGTLFFDKRGVTRLPDLSWPAALADARGEYLHVGQAHQPILFLGSSAVVRASQHGSQWTFAAHSVGWADPDRFASEQEMTLGYWRGRPALQLAWQESGTATGNAVMLPFQESGALFAAPIVVPTQGDLPAQPQPCPAAAFNETPRVVAQPQWGTRHPVTISDAAVSFTLLSAGAVLHGTKQQPCVAAYEAMPIAESREDMLSAIIETTAPDRAWLFRQARDATLEYRRMSCDFDSAAP